jgi:hypothetical protein
MITYKKYFLFNEGGAYGHMQHPFDIDSVNSGQDLIDFFNRAYDSLAKEPGALKIDGVNASIKFIGKEFALDRGSNYPIDVEGITIPRLGERFPEGHGMIKIGANVLSFFNNALGSIQDELSKLGMLDNPNLLFNLEYVDGSTNVLEYDEKFIAIHGLLEMYQATPRKRGSKEANYNPDVMKSLIDKLNASGEFKVFGSVDVSAGERPNYNAVLSQNVEIPYEQASNEVKPLSQWLQEIKIPKRVRLKRINGTPREAISKANYMDIILQQVPVDTLYQDPNQQKAAIDGALVYHATRFLGKALLETLDSAMGRVDSHEGVVIRDPRIDTQPVKITGDFIIQGLQSQFRQ